MGSGHMMEVQNSQRQLLWNLKILSTASNLPNHLGSPTIPNRSLIQHMLAASKLQLRSDANDKITTDTSPLDLDYRMFSLHYQVGSTVALLNYSLESCLQFVWMLQTCASQHLMPMCSVTFRRSQHDALRRRLEHLGA